MVDLKGVSISAPGSRRSNGRSQAVLGPPKPPAAPVFEGVWERSKNVAWQRACHLLANEHAIVVDDLGLGTASATVSRVTVELALADLAVLSGESGEVAVEALAAGKVPELIDGYFTTTRRLVMRWAVTEATVVRAVQIQPASGQLTIVGEGIASSPLDLVEFDLLAPMLPLMLVATSPGGEIEGLACLAFPSLLRGGPHYVETVSDDADKRVSPMDFSVVLERSLRGLRSGKSKPLLKEIKVDLGGADASTPLFQRDLRDMLSRVIGIALLPELSEAANPRLNVIAAAVALKPRHARSTGATLTLSADMIPSLTLLVAATDGSSASRDLAMPLAIVEPDPSQPAICFVPPPIKNATPPLRSPAYGLPFPRLRGRFTASPLAAIRTLVRPLDDAELLVPDMALVPNPGAASVDDRLADCAEGMEGRTSSAGTHRVEASTWRGEPITLLHW